MSSRTEASFHRDPRIEFFNVQAATWDRDGPDTDQMIRSLQQHQQLLRFSAGLDVLEVGCGTGAVTGWLVEKVAPGRVVAVDFADQMLAQAARKGIDAEFRCIDVCCVELGTNLYDIAFCLHCFPHFRDKQAALNNLARALKPTGRLIVMHLKSSEQVNAFHDHIGGAVAGDHLPQGEAWDMLLEESGLRKTELIDREGLFFLNAVPQRRRSN